MTSRVIALRVDANDPDRLGRFWAGLLGWKMSECLPDEFALRPSDDTEFRMRFVRTQEQKRSQNRIHGDLTSTSAEDQRQVVARALELGASPADVGQRPDQPHVVLVDPEGNEFCVIEPENQFLADCGFIGALACDGTQEVGYFWSAALDWPLVWDQDGETAIRSPRGGPKITWGGPPVTPKNGTNRLRVDLAPTAGTDLQDEIDRLLLLGATRPDVGRDDRDNDRVRMADPDGNEFCVFTPR